MNIASGTYTGNGADDRPITGIGFTPVLVIIVRSTGIWSWRSATMAGDVSLDMSGGDVLTDRIQSLDSDGFTVGTSGDVNANLATYYYIAFAADTAILEYGSYTGDGIDGKLITTTLTPVFCLVQHGAGAGNTGVWRTSTIVGDNSFAINSALGYAADRIQTLAVGGFTVGGAATVNTLNETYYYFILAANSTQISVGSYVGDNNDNRDITTSPAIEPKLVWLKRHSTANNNTGAVRLPNPGGDSASKLGTGDLGDVIQAANTNGFEVGTDYTANGNDGGGAGVNTYFYLTIAGVSVPATIPALPTLPGGAFSFMPFSPYQRYKGIRMLTEALRNARLGP